MASYSNILLFYFLTTLFVIGKQEIGHCQRNLSLGGEKWGLAFGNPTIYSGIRLNLFDLKESECLNGINFSFISLTKKTNGLNISLISKSSNQIFISFAGEPKKIISISRGIKISLIIINGYHNGLQIGAYNKCLNYRGKGLLMGIVNSHMYGNKCMCYATQHGLLIGILNKGITTKGLQIGALNYRTSSTFTIGLINRERIAKAQIGLVNYLIEGKGVQIGIINIRKKNKWFAKVLPLVNFKWEKKQNETQLQ